METKGATYRQTNQRGINALPRLTGYNYTAVRVNPCVGRNDPCPCGSGKKYKRCCLDSEKMFENNENAVELYLEEKERENNGV